MLARRKMQTSPQAPAIFATTNAAAIITQNRQFHFVDEEIELVKDK